MSMTGVYNRLGLHVLASNLALIRAAHKRIDKPKRKHPDYREARKQFYRRMIETHSEAAALYFSQFKS